MLGRPEGQNVLAEPSVHTVGGRQEPKYPPNRPRDGRAGVVVRGRDLRLRLAPEEMTDGPAEVSR